MLFFIIKKEKRPHYHNGAKTTFYAFKPGILELLAKKYKIDPKNN
jgi:hypothetical protein